jgi:hypothetical protein
MNSQLNNIILKHSVARNLLENITLSTILMCNTSFEETFQKFLHITLHVSTNTINSRVKVKVTSRLTISRPVRLGVKRPSGTRDQFFYLLEIFFQTVTVCYVVAPSLTRGRVCNLLLLLVLASAVMLGSVLSDERSGLSFVSISL